MKTKQRFLKHDYLGFKRLKYMSQQLLLDCFIIKDHNITFGKELYFLNLLSYHAKECDIEIKFLNYYFDYEEYDINDLRAYFK